ncbi:hypothetical protein ACHHYP_08104 [Achlya hypogyna]|uniref:BRCA2 OB1 domain-containing protein n=1 Tax=Achlya hypogyna TaxID=1202772 RepID=A0A1V9YPN4_ACHHY|nr:hypothetical protein ACHHYP_08104 [Achlya hypogyna]
MLRYRRPAGERKGLRDVTNDMKRPAHGGHADDGGKEKPSSENHRFRVPMSKKRRLDDGIVSTPSFDGRPPRATMPQAVEQSGHRDGGIKIYVDSPETLAAPATRPPIDMTDTKMVTSLFQSGHGKSVLIPAKKIQEFEAKIAKFSEDTDQVEPLVTLQDSRPDDTSSNEPTNNTVASMFQTGSGRSVRVSIDKVQSYQLQFEAAETTNGTSTAKRPADDPCTSTVLSLFQSGHGKQLQVSADLVAKYDHSFDSDPLPQAGFVSREETQPVKRSMPAPTSSSVVTSLFSTAAGASVTISAAKIQQYEAAFEQDVVDHSAASYGAASFHVVPTLFQTAGGRHVHVSEASVRRYQEQLNNEPLEADSAAGTNLPLAESESALESVQKTTPFLLKGSSDAFLQKSPLPDTTTSLFSTASGRSVHISAEKTKAYQRLFDSEEPSKGRDMEAADAGTTISLFSTAGGRVVEISAEKAQQYERLYDTEEQEKPTEVLAEEPQSTVESEFGGRHVDVSRDNVPKYEAKLRKDAAKEPTEPVASHSQLRRSTGVEVTPAAKPPPPRRFSSAPGGPTPRVEPELSKAVVPAPTRMPSAANGRRAFQPPRRKSMPAPTVVDSVHGTKKPKEVAVQSKSKYKQPKTTTLSFHDLKPTAPSSAHSCVYSVTAANAVAVHFTPRGDPVLSPAFGATSVHLLYATMVSNQYILPSLGATLPWFLNHFRWIVWKCASMERMFGDDLYGQYMTLEQVTFQLTRRYQRELEQSHRSVLKKVYQRDAHSGNAMVLVVVATFPTHWVLSDGWYAIFTLPDEYLLARGPRNLVGTKVVVWNASLINCNEGIDPLESPVHESFSIHFDPKTHVHLSINVNSTRRVHWRLPLGLEDRRKHQLLQSLPLMALKQRGGLVRSIRAVVLRSSGLLFLQPKDATGPRVLTEKMLENFPQAFATAVPFLRLKIACSHPTSASRTATLSVWRPSEDVQVTCKEGVEVFVTSVAVTWSAEKKDPELNLSTSKHSTFTRTPTDDLASVHARVGYSPRTCMSIAEIGPTYIGDADVCVYVIRVSEDRSHAFVTDASLKLLSIRLPTALSAAALKLWKKGAIVCVRNLLVSHYDEGLGLLDSVLTDTAEATRQPSKASYFAASFEALKLSIENGANQTLLQALDAYILSTILHAVGTQATQATQDATPELTQGLALDANTSDDIERHDMAIEGHPIRVCGLQDSEYSAVVFFDVGSQLCEVYLPHALEDSLGDVSAADFGLCAMRVLVKVHTDDARSNSCRRWEVASATKLVALAVEVLPTKDRIQALLAALQL